MAKLKQGSLIGGSLPLNITDYDKNNYPYFTGDQGDQGEQKHKSHSDKFQWKFLTNKGNFARQPKDDITYSGKNLIENDSGFWIWTHNAVYHVTPNHLLTPESIFDQLVDEKLGADESFRIFITLSNDVLRQLGGIAPASD